MADDERAAKRKRYASRIITLKVGTEKEDVTIHEDLLSEHSPFFKAGLEKKWKEGESGEFVLAEEEFDVVVGYVHWLYKGEVMNVLKADGTKRVDYMFLAKSYVLGEMAQDDDFCNDILTALLSGMQKKDQSGKTWCPLGRPISTIYAGTTDGAPIRRMLVVMFVERAPVEWLDGSTDVLPMEFMRDVSREFIQRRAKNVYQPMLERKEEWFKKREEAKAGSPKA